MSNDYWWWIVKYPNEEAVVCEAFTLHVHDMEKHLRRGYVDYEGPYSSEAGAVKAIAQFLVKLAH